MRDHQNTWVIHNLGKKWLRRAWSPTALVLGPKTRVNEPAASVMRLLQRKVNPYDTSADFVSIWQLEMGTGYTAAD